MRRRATRVTARAARRPRSPGGPVLARRSVRLRSLALAVTILASAPLAAAAVDYHLSPAGDDAADGTATAPWRSIDASTAKRSAPATASCSRGAGSSLATSSSPRRATADPASPITVGSYGRGRAVIRAGRGTGVRVEDLGGVVIRDLLVVGDGLDVNEGFGVLVLHRRPDEARLECVRIEDVEARGFRWAGLYVGGVPDGLPGFHAGWGAALASATSRSADARHARTSTTASTSMGREEPRRRPTTPTETSSSPIASPPTTPATRTTRRTTAATVSSWTTPTAPSLRLRCPRQRRGQRRPDGRAGRDLDLRLERLTIQSCESYGNRTGGAADGGGFDLDGGVTNSVIQYCYSHDNDGPGFMAWNYAGAPHRLAGNVIRYNISAGDARKHRYGGISVGTSEAPVRDLLVHNNTIYTTRIPGGEPQCVRVWERAGEGLAVRQQPVRHRRRRPGGRLRGARRRGPLRRQRLLGRRRRVPRPAWRRGFNGLAAWRAATGQERWRGEDVGLHGDPRLSGLSERDGRGRRPADRPPPLPAPRGLAAHRRRARPRSVHRARPRRPRLLGHPPPKGAAYRRRGERARPVREMTGRAQSRTARPSVDSRGKPGFDKSPTSRPSPGRPTTSRGCSRRRRDRVDGVQVG